jgi:GT2 family glycosyltransferase
MSFPFISVILPTYRREELLQDTIEAVLQQEYPNFELIVVDQTQNHKPEVQTYLDEMAAAGKIQFFQVNWASLPGARNYAVRRAEGDIFLFIDDDIQLPEGFLQAHAKNFVENSDIGAVAGRVFDRMKLSNSGNKLTIEDLPPEAMDPGIALYYLDLVHTTKAQQVLSVRGCNMSFRRDIFDKWGLTFDERFRGSAIREESDFCLQLRRTGYKIWYDPNAYLIHLGEETGGCHDISTRSVQYQLTFYHNHFLMGLKNLTPAQNVRFFGKLFDCHVLGHPPCNKNPSLAKTFIRGGFYTLAFLQALGTMMQSIWDNGQVYTKLETNKNHLSLSTQQNEPSKIQETK